MKKILILLLFVICSNEIFAQSTELEKLFADLKYTFSKYTIETSVKGNYSYYSSHVLISSISFDYPNLILICHPSKNKSDVHKLFVPINSTTFAISYYVPRFNDTVSAHLVVKNRNGIEHLYQGKTDVVTSKTFYSDKLVTERLCEQLIAFRKLVLSEGFKGTLTMVSNPSRNTSTTKITSKKSKSGNYGQ